MNLTAGMLPLKYPSVWIVFQLLWLMLLPLLVVARFFFFSTFLLLSLSLCNLRHVLGHINRISRGGFQARLVKPTEEGRGKKYDNVEIKKCYLEEVLIFFQRQEIPNFRSLHLTGGPVLKVGFLFSAFKRKLFFNCLILKLEMLFQFLEST